MEVYRRGLTSARERRGKTIDPLMPSWGEAELLMNLAWSNLNRKEPDVSAAKEYANAALAQVPNWHYVRDILMPQIREAANKATASVRK